MRRERSQHHVRGPRGPAEPTRIREFDLRRRLQDAEERNAVLRAALADIVEWYDRFDEVQPNDARELTDDDFERYRRLSKVFFRRRS